VTILNTYVKSNNRDNTYAYKHYTNIGSEGDYVSTIRNAIEYSLQNNYPLMIRIQIEHTDPFTYTSTGHWVVIDGLDRATDEIHICDPGSSRKPYQSIDLTTFLESYFFIGKDKANIIAYFPTTQEVI
jgi:hypothetical protein